MTTATASTASIPSTRALLRVEGAITFVFAAAAYHALGGSWGQFALWFFAILSSLPLTAAS